MQPPLTGVRNKVIVMRTMCAGFVRTTIRAGLSLLEKNTGTSARFYVYITEKSHTRNVMYLLPRLRITF